MNLIEHTQRDKDLTQSLRIAVDRYNRSRNKDVKKRIFREEIAPIDIERDKLRNEEHR